MLAFAPQTEDLDGQGAEYPPIAPTSMEDWASSWWELISAQRPSCRDPPPGISVQICTNTLNIYSAGRETALGQEGIQEALSLKPSAILLCVPHGQALAAAHGDGRTSAVHPTGAQSFSAGHVTEVCPSPQGATDCLRLCWVG